jgi:hypothetical protein
VFYLQVFCHKAPLMCARAATLLDCFTSLAHNLQSPNPAKLAKSAAGQALCRTGHTVHVSLLPV